MNQRRWGLPLGGIKISVEIVRFQVAPEGVKCMDKRIESGRELETIGAAARKQREPKIRLARGTCKRIEEKDDLRTRYGR